jgi:hypothetical protein
LQADSGLASSFLPPFSKQTHQRSWTMSEPVDDETEDSNHPPRPSNGEAIRSLGRSPSSRPYAVRPQHSRNETAPSDGSDGSDDVAGRLAMGSARPAHVWRSAQYGAERESDGAAGDRRLSWLGASFCSSCPW